MKLSLLQHSKDTSPQTVSLQQVVELIRTGNNFAMPICSVAAILERGYRQKDIESMTGLAVVSYTNLEDSCVAELREEARADPHTLLLFGAGNTINIIFGYELDRSYELRQQKQFYPKAYDFGCDYYDQLLELKADRTEKGRTVQLIHDADVSYQEYAEPFYVWEIKEANTAKREGRKTRGQPKERKPNWTEQLACVQDIKDYLGNHIKLRHNVVTARVEYWLPDKSEEWQPIDDRIVNDLWEDMSHEKKVRKDEMRSVIESHYSTDYNPFHDYFSRLPPWDGSNNILALSATVIVKGGLKKQEFFYKCLRKWLVGMVAAWLDPTVVNHVILVLIGEQGIYKTTWFQYLLPPELRAYFYTKTNASRMSRDDLLTLAQYALICCEELDTMRPFEMNQLKAAVTMQTINERAAYAHYHERRKHIASFCGTGNNVQFLNDPTGNRRWLPFEVESIMSPHDFPVDYEGVFAEAYALYQKGFSYWFTSSEIEQLSKHNEAFEATHAELEEIQKHFRLPGPGEEGEFVTRTDIYTTISWNHTLKLDIDKIGPAMTKLGFKRKRFSSERGYIVCRYTEPEKVERKRAKALIAKDEDDSDNDNDDTNDTVFL